MAEVRIELDHDSSRISFDEREGWLVLGNELPAPDVRFVPHEFIFFLPVS